MIHLRILNTMPPLFGTSFFLCCSFRDCGCGKAMSFDDFFRRERKRDKNWRYKDPMNPSERLDQLIAGLTDWRGKTLASVRKSILEADREIIEVGNAHKDKVKLTFSHGASLPDPDKLFNAGLGGNAWRAIDFFEGDKINERALKNLIRAAVDYNHMKLKSKAPAGTRAKVRKVKS